MDAWVYVDGQFIGAYEVPATIPILKTGVHDLVIIAGIKKNGISNNRTIYPFYSTYRDSHNFEAAVVDTLIPEVEYRPGAKFEWLEDFEDQSISLEKSGSQSTVDSMYLVSNPAEVFEYNGSTEQFSAGATLDTGFQIFEFSSNRIFDLPRGSEIYLELNFKSESEIIVGIYPITGPVVQGVPIVNLFSTEGEWKKVYISLAEDVNTAQFQGADFRVFLASQKNTASQAKLAFDNIKLITFE
ncbi:hypothetical protein GYB22_12180 [bacterium]|nr:hypothetical protein [bacterium]